MEYIKWLWKGDVPLWQSFWVFGVAGSLSLYLGLFLLIPALSLPLVFAYVAVIYTYLVFVLVAIWRSATKYTGNKVWAYLSKFVVVAALSVFIYRFSVHHIMLLIPLIAVSTSITLYYKYLLASAGSYVVFALFITGLLAAGTVVGWYGIERGIEYSCSHGGGNLCGLEGYFFSGPLAFSLATIAYTFLWFVCVIAFKALKLPH